MKKIFLSETTLPRMLMFDVYHHQVNLYQDCSNYAPGAKHSPKIVSDYDQKIPQSHTADNPKAPRVRATQPSRDTRETN